jgi:tetratricopeptide (TPR) repeat protein
MRCHALAFALTLIAAPAAAHDPQKLGTVAFPNTCSPAIQTEFQRAVALLHSFWWDEAEDAFRQVLKDDPHCAIADWGIATVAIGNPFAGVATQGDANKAAAAIADARATGAGSEREKSYIEAIAAYWDRFGERTHLARLRSLSDAFEVLAKQYPDDDETQIFDALYLAGTQNPMDKSFSRARRAIAMLEPQQQKHPDHPGVSHYLIHANDYPPIAAQGLDAAMCYADIAPAAPHALHMPSHIFTRVGLWEQSAATNARSVQAAETAGLITDRLHAYDYMVYADLQLARDAQAARVVAAVAPLHDPNRTADYARAAIPARYAVERSAWAEAAALPDPDPSKFVYTTAIRYFGRALGRAQTGDISGAEADLARLREIEAALQAAKDEYWSTEVDVQVLAAQATIAYAKGEHQEALRLMLAAADKEDTSEKSAVSPGRLIPARELLGDMLLREGQPKQALAAYEESMAHDPRRFRSLAGAANAAAQAGDTAKARLYSAQLVTMAGSGDARPEVTAARAYLASR